jgi:hypothetical protein
MPVRRRDYLRTIYGLDTDAWIHPSLIRFLAGYLDQGLAHWTMPDRSPRSDRINSILPLRRHS